MHIPNGITRVNVNTYVSIGLVITLMVATIWINNSVQQTQATVANAELRITSRIEGQETKVSDVLKRMDLFESRKETWGYQDMFRWAVHLQRDNPQIKVPEPEPNSK